MGRGEIWSAAGGGDYTTKPRPVLILQDDRFDALESVTICSFTTDESDAPIARVLVQPDEVNGLQTASRVMVDKITTLRKTRLGSQIGRLQEDDMARVNQAVLVFLGFSGPTRRRRSR
jgi:mRNA interferase MazF